MSENALSAVFFIAIAIAIASPWSCSSCGHEMTDCASACAKSSQAMRSYSSLKGCECAVGTGGDAGK